MATPTGQSREEAGFVPCKGRVSVAAVEARGEDSAKTEDRALCELARLLRSVPPVVFVIGDSTSCLDALYRRLPEAVLQAVVIPATTLRPRGTALLRAPDNAPQKERARRAAHTKRLVTHNASVHGCTFCLDRSLWIAFHAGKCRTSTTTSNGATQGGALVPPPSRDGQNTRREARIAVRATASCKVEDATDKSVRKGKTKPCHWVVPRFLFSVQELLPLLRGWLWEHRFLRAPCPHTTLLIFVNTDLTDERVVQVQVRNKLMVRGDSFVKVAHYWARFSASVNGVIAAYGALSSAPARRGGQRGARLNAPLLQWLKGCFPAVLLDSATLTPSEGQARVVRRRTILNFYPRCLPLPSSRVAPDPAQWGLQQVLRVLSPPREVAAETAVGMDMTECCLYADTSSITIAANRLAQANRTAATTLENLWDSQLFFAHHDAAHQLSSSAAQDASSRTNTMVNCEDVPAQAGLVYRYAPIVTSVTPPTANPAALGHVYIFEFDPDLLRVKGAGYKWAAHAMGATRGGAEQEAGGRTQRLRGRGLAFATRRYLRRGTMRRARQMMSQAQLYARRLLGEKARMSWPMTSNVEGKIRFALCATLPPATQCLADLLHVSRSPWPQDVAAEPARSCSTRLRAVWESEARSRLYPLLRALANLRRQGWKLIFHQDLAAYLDARCELDRQPVRGDEEYPSRRCDGAADGWASVGTVGEEAPACTARAPCPGDLVAPPWQHRMALVQGNLALSTMTKALERQLWQAELVSELRSIHLYVGLRVIVAGRYRGVITGFRALTHKLLKQDLFLVNLLRFSSKPRTGPPRVGSQDARERRCLLYSPPHPTFLAWWQQQRSPYAGHGGVPASTATLWPPFLPPYMENMEALRWPEVTLDMETTFSVLVLPSVVRTFITNAGTPQTMSDMNTDAANRSTPSSLQSSESPSTIDTPHKALVRRVTILKLPLQLTQGMAVTTFYLSRAMPTRCAAGAPLDPKASERLARAKWYALHQQDVLHAKHIFVGCRPDSVMLPRCRCAPRRIDLPSFATRQRRLRCVVACATHFHCLVK